jgi:hypothetical protein
LLPRKPLDAPATQSDVDPFPLAGLVAKYRHQEATAGAKLPSMGRSVVEPKLNESNGLARQPLGGVATDNSNLGIVIALHLSAWR